MRVPFQPESQPGWACAETKGASVSMLAPVFGNAAKAQEYRAKSLPTMRLPIPKIPTPAVPKKPLSSQRRTDAWLVVFAWTAACAHPPPHQLKPDKPVTVAPAAPRPGRHAASGMVNVALPPPPELL